MNLRDEQGAILTAWEARIRIAGFVGVTPGRVRLVHPVTQRVLFDPEVVCSGEVSCVLLKVDPFLEARAEARLVQEMHGTPISTLTEATSLDCGARELYELPESFGTLVNLVLLGLSSCRLRSLPEAFCDLQALRVLNLRNNYFKTFPEPLRHLHLLEDLSLDNNNMQALPEYFGEIASLTLLNISSNRIRTLPESFGALRFAWKARGNR